MECNPFCLEKIGLKVNRSERRKEIFYIAFKRIYVTYYSPIARMLKLGNDNWEIDLFNVKSYGSLRLKFFTEES